MEKRKNILKGLLAVFLMVFVVSGVLSQMAFVSAIVPGLNNQEGITGGLAEVTSMGGNSGKHGAVSHTTSTSDGPVLITEPEQNSLPYLVGAFLNAKGFILNSKAQEGYELEIHLNNEDSHLSGFLEFTDELYEIEGSIVGEAGNSGGGSSLIIEFDLISREDKYVVGSFEGSLDLYRNFRVLEGELEYRNKDWVLTVYEQGAFEVYKKGDVNADGNVDLNDVYFLVSYIFEGGEAPEPLERGDVNGDGEVNVSDVVYLFKMIYNGGITQDNP